MIRKYIKIVLILFSFILFLMTSFCVGVVIRDKTRKLRWFSMIGSYISKIGLTILQIKWQVKNAERLPKNNQNYLIVSNHLCYIDILVIAASVRSVFVANAELQEEFPLGIATRYGGGVFVERRSRAKLSEEINSVSEILDTGFNVVLFPEGTTSDGEKVMPFKTSFFAPVAGSDGEILPVCIKYKRVNGEDVNEENKHLVYYYGGVTFFEHFFRLISLKSVEIEITVLEPIKANSEVSRKELAKIAHDSISFTYTS